MVGGEKHEVSNDSDERTHPAPIESPGRPWMRSAWLAISACLCLAMAACYWFRWDAVSALTVFPVWLWMLPGLLLTAPARRRIKKRWAIGVVAMWCVYLIVLAEEPRSLAALAVAPRDNVQTGGQPRRIVRVVTLNCAAGNGDAAKEVTPYRPDIVLLQEPPSRVAVETLAKDLFGDEGNVAWDLSGAILARGTVLPRKLSNQLRACSVAARVQLNSGETAEVVCVHLDSALARLDLWSPDCWREQTANRRKRCGQMLAVAGQLDLLPAGRSIILGGDFNAPAGDPACRMLEPLLHDTLPEGGRGWPNTITNEYPVLRIDQVWTSADLRATSVRAVKTQNSDHRLVICDLIVVPK